MNGKLPNLLIALTSLGILLGGAGGQRSILAQTPLSSPQAGPSPAAAAPQPPAPNGQSLLIQSARLLLAENALEARLRQRVHLYDQVLVGGGRYLQLGEGPEKYMLLELKLAAGGKTTSLIQVSDRQRLWTRHDLPSGQRVSYVNLARIRQSVRQSGISAHDPLGHWMALGGLPQLLHGLHRNFQFGAAAAESLGEHPVWRLEGTWKPESLKRIFPQDEARPEHTPDRVVLLLGRDQVLPMFPYRIEYQKQVDGKLQPTVVLELFEVRRRTDLTPAEFSYDPGDQKVHDRTGWLLESLGLPES